MLLAIVGILIVLAFMITFAYAAGAFTPRGTAAGGTEGGLFRDRRDAVAESLAAGDEVQCTVWTDRVDTEVRSLAFPVPPGGIAGVGDGMVLVLSPLPAYTLAFPCLTACSTREGRYLVGGIGRIVPEAQAAGEMERLSDPAARWAFWKESEMPGAFSERGSELHYDASLGKLVRP